MVVFYRKWSFKERSLSKETPLTITKDKPPVIQPMKNCESLNLQYASNLSSSSADLKATNNGWPSNPARKSEKARQNNSVNDRESSFKFQVSSLLRKIEKIQNMIYHCSQLAIAIRGQQWLDTK